MEFNMGLLDNLLPGNCLTKKSVLLPTMQV